MANWEKLNKEFDQVMNNMTDQDWINWQNNRLVNKQKRQADLQNRTALWLKKQNERKLN